MTNWFQTQEAARLFEKKLYVDNAHCSCLAQIQGCGWTKRAIIQGGLAIEAAPTGSGTDQSCHIGQVQEQVTHLMTDLVQEAQHQGCVYVEMRCFDDYSPYRHTLEKIGLIYQPHYDVLLDVHHPVPEVKMRQIRMAMQQGQQWREAQNIEDVKAFYTCLKKLYRNKVHRPLPHEAFFIKAWQQGVKVLVVQQTNKEIIGGVLMPVLDAKAYEWYICGPIMSTWAMIEYCQQNAIAQIDMMGAGEPGVPYGVRDFKLQMGGELKEWGRYLYVLKPRIYQLGKWWVTRKSV